MSTRTFGRETKFQKVRTELESLANRLGPEQKLPPIRELAVTMNASVSTLTGVLEELENQNLVYRRHGVGIFVSPSRIKSIWLICDSQFFSEGYSPFWNVLIAHARSRASQNNEHLSMHFTMPHGYPDAILHHTLVEEIRAGRVHGILGVGLRRPTARWIISQGVPFTAFAGWAPYVVNLNYRELINLGIRELRQRGCRRIGFWNPTVSVVEDVEDKPSRCFPTDIFYECMAGQGLEVDASLVKNNWNLAGLPTNESNSQQGYRTAREVFEQTSNRPDGILISDDSMTQGALLALAQMGIRPGRDVLVASHSNKGTPLLLESANDMIRIEFDPAELVQRLFDMLETLMAGQIPTTTTQTASDLNIEFVHPRVLLPAV